MATLRFWFIRRGLRSVNGDDGKSGGVVGMDGVGYRTGDLLVGHLDFIGNRDVENQVGVGISGDDAKVMNEQGRVNLLCVCDGRGAKFIHQGVVGDHGIHVYRGQDVMLTFQLALDEIHHVVGFEHILRAVHLNMKGGDDSPGAIVVNHQIVHPQHAVVMGDRRLNDGHGFLGRAFAEDGVFGIVQYLDARNHDEDGHQESHITVDVEAREFEDEGGDQHGEGGGGIRQAVGGGGAHDGGVNLFGDLTIEQAEPQFDHHRHAQHSDRDPAEPGGGGRVKNFSHGFSEKFVADEQNQKRHDHGGHVFNARVAEGVVAVGRLCRDFEGDEGDDLRAGVREVIDGIGLDRDGAEQKADGEFSACQQEVKDDAHRAGQRAIGVSGGGGCGVGGFYKEFAK